MKFRAKTWQNIVFGLICAVGLFIFWAHFLQGYRLAFLIFGPIFFGLFMFGRGVINFLVGKTIEILPTELRYLRWSHVVSSIGLKKISRENWSYRVERKSSTGPGFTDIFLAGASGLNLTLPDVAIRLEEFNTGKILAALSEAKVQIPRYVLFSEGTDFCEILFDEKTKVSVLERNMETGDYDFEVDLVNSTIVKNPKATVIFSLNKLLAKESDELSFEDALYKGFQVGGHIMRLVKI